MIRHLSWAEIVQKAWGKDWTKPVTAYEFTGGRKFEDHPVNWPPGEEYAEDYADQFADFL